jgi:hypothetical protein
MVGGGVEGAEDSEARIAKKDLMIILFVWPTSRWERNLNVWQTYKERDHPNQRENSKPRKFCPWGLKWGVVMQFLTYMGEHIKVIVFK